MIRRRRPIQRSRKPIARSPIVRKPPRTRSVNILKPTYTTRRERRRAEYREQRPIVRAFCFDRDGGRCRCPCQRQLKLSTDNPFELYHGNEILSRALGGDPLDAANVVGMAPECHLQFTNGDLKITTSDRGANGALWFTGVLAGGRCVIGYQSMPAIHLED